MATQVQDKMYRYPPGQVPQGFQVNNPQAIAQAATPKPVNPSPTMQGFASMFGQNGVNDLMYRFPPGTRLQDLEQNFGQISNLVQSNAGIFPKFEQGLVEWGTDRNGNKMYVPQGLQGAPVNGRAGQQQLQDIGGVIDKMGAFGSKEEAAAFVKYAKMAGDPRFISNITTSLANGDQKGAINALMNQFGRPGLESLLTEGKTPEEAKAMREDIGTAFAAYNVFNNWDRMNDSQRSLAVAGLGMKAYKFATGENLSNKVLVASSTPNGPSLTVGGAMGLMSAGINVYSMMKNWDQMDAMQRLVYGTGTASQMATFAKQFGLLGSGTSGAAVGTTSAAQLSAAGFSSMPSAGVGAVVGPANAVPAGYTAIGTAANGQVIAAPSNLAGTAATTNGTSAVSVLGTAAGVAAVGYGAYQVYQGWGQGGKDGAINGAVGGTAIASGMYALGYSNPYLLAGIVAVSVAGNAIEMNEKESGASSGAAAGAAVGGTIGSVVPVVGTAIGAGIGAVVGGVAGYAMAGGKSKDQLGRDHVRGLLQKTKLVNDDFKVLNAADGSLADVGIDGHGNEHEFRFKDKVPAGNEVRTLHSYDVDYTNDLDFSANIGTTAITRLLLGGKGKQVDQLAGQLANASLGAVGHGQDMTEETFGYVQKNLRGYWNQVGIKSKEDAYALANQAFAEGRLTEMDLISTHQGINMAFDDDGFDTAQQLMAGRFKGIEVATQIPRAPGPNMNVVEKPQEATNKPLFIPMSPNAGTPMGMSQMAGNQNIIAYTKPAYGLEMDMGNYIRPANAGNFESALKEWEQSYFQQVTLPQAARAADMTKEEIRALNQRRFGNA